MLNQDQIDILRETLAALEAKERRVRTQSGVDKYGQPIGAVIVADGIGGAVPDAPDIPSVDNSEPAIEDGQVESTLREVFDGEITVNDTTVYSRVDISIDEEGIVGISGRIYSGNPDNPDAGYPDEMLIGEYYRTYDPKSETFNLYALQIGENLWGQPLSKGSTSFQGKGIGREINRRSIEAAEKVGAKKITIDAQADGKIAWAHEKYGFSFSEIPSSLTGDGVREHLETRFYSLYDDEYRNEETYKAKYDPELSKQLDDIIERFKGPKSGWPTPSEILRLGEGKETHAWAEGIDKYEDTLGMFILREKGWQGEREVGKPISSPTAEEYEQLELAGMPEPIRRDFIGIERSDKGVSEFDLGNVDGVVRPYKPRPIRIKDVIKREGRDKERLEIQAMEEYSERNVAYADPKYKQNGLQLAQAFEQYEGNWLSPAKDSAKVLTKIAVNEQIARRMLDHMEADPEFRGWVENFPHEEEFAAAKYKAIFSGRDYGANGIEFRRLFVKDLDLYKDISLDDAVEAFVLESVGEFEYEEDKVSALETWKEKFASAPPEEVWFISKNQKLSSLERLQRPEEIVAHIIKTNNGEYRIARYSDITPEAKKRVVTKERARKVLEGTVHIDEYGNPTIISSTYLANRPELLDRFSYSEVTMRMLIRAQVDRWAHTSADSDEDSIAMQYAALEVFGLEDVSETRHFSSLSNLDYYQLGPFREVFAKAVYENTQDYFRENGIEYVYGYRGMKWDINEVPDWAISESPIRIQQERDDAVQDALSEFQESYLLENSGQIQAEVNEAIEENFQLWKRRSDYYDDADFDLSEATEEQLEEWDASKIEEFLELYYDETESRVKESWEDSAQSLFYDSGGAEAVAYDFDLEQYKPTGELITVVSQPLSSWSTNESTASDFASGEDNYGIVVSGKIPVERIFCTSVTGLGCLNEGEFVVLGDLDDLYVE